MNRRAWVLPVIVFSQFCCTSLWFAGNAVMQDLAKTYALDQNALGHITSAVQFGFIAGTLVFALYTVADRFSPSKVFLFSALLGALFNLAVIIEGNVFVGLLALRFFTGFFLAGIYPIGMKIASDYYQKGLGKSLGYLVGALVLGTAFPHLIKSFTIDLPWRGVLVITSAIAVLGGLLIYLFVPNGPYRKQSQRPDLTAWYKVFKNIEFRSAAFGYFGHMWELYAFWAFVPVMIKTYNVLHPYHEFNIPLWSFLIIGLGSLSCIAGGYISQYLGAKKTAASALFMSCLCCLSSPLFLNLENAYLFIGFLVFWGLVVIADSPLFSTVVAQSTVEESKGTALTITNCIGFSITIVSIQLINLLQGIINPIYIYVVLAVGPIIGLYGLYTKKIHVFT